jgi:hypothetical protein
MQINLDKAKTIAHERRRVARDQEFLPLDREVNIPSKATEAESKRQAVRDKYAVIQDQIDAASSVQELAAVKPKG